MIRNLEIANYKVVLISHRSRLHKIRVTDTFLPIYVQHRGKVSVCVCEKERKRNRERLPER